MAAHYCLHYCLLITCLIKCQCRCFHSGTKLTVAGSMDQGCFLYNTSYKTWELVIMNRLWCPLEKSGIEPITFRFRTLPLDFNCTPWWAKTSSHLERGNKAYTTISSLAETCKTIVITSLRNLIKDRRDARKWVRFNTDFTWHVETHGQCFNPWATGAASDLFIISNHLSLCCRSRPGAGCGGSQQEVHGAQWGTVWRSNWLSLAASGVHCRTGNGFKPTRTNSLLKLNFPAGFLFTADCLHLDSVDYFVFFFLWQWKWQLLM